MYYKLIAVDLSRQKECDADLKAIQKIEFGQLKSTAEANAAGESMFAFSFLEKIKEMRLKFSQRSVKGDKLWRNKS